MPRDVPKVTFILPKTPHRLLLFSFWTLEEVLDFRASHLAAAVIEASLNEFLTRDQNILTV